jgi:quinol monooxygenase YgiN
MTTKSRELLGIARFKIKEGKLEEYKRLSDQAMEKVRTNEPGTLQYDIYFNDDESEVMVIERYRDSEALLAHVANLGELFGAIVATVEVIHGECLGEASPELKAKFVGSPVRFFNPYLSK